MARRKSFWGEIFEKLEDFGLRLVDRFIKWIEAIIEWVEDLISEIAKESKTYILWIVIFCFGAVIYLFEKHIPLDETHHQRLSMASAIISLMSLGMLGISMTKTVLISLGLLEAAIKLRDKILEKLNLL